jgi:hypothetical protein
VNDFGLLTSEVMLFPLVKPYVGFPARNPYFTLIFAAPPRNAWLGSGSFVVGRQDLFSDEPLVQPKSAPWF